jgi:hypothetical protein
MAAPSLCRASASHRVTGSNQMQEIETCRARFARASMRNVSKRSRHDRDETLADESRFRTVANNCLCLSSMNMREV